ncbi:TPA: GNAT family N-acetyltransferase [Enterobacter hormaechei]
MSPEFSSKRKPGVITYAEQTDILERINGYLHTVYPYKRNSACICDNYKEHAESFRIITHRKKFDIYLRFGKYWVDENQKTITIARIGFHQQRSGHGTRLLRLLSEIAAQHGYKYIAIEQVNDNSERFALRYGFKKSTLYTSCYFIAVAELVGSLKLACSQMASVD